MEKNLEGNRVLAALPSEDRAALARHLYPVTLRTEQVLFDQDQQIETIYFPVRAVVSLMQPMLDGTSIEVATVGNEGVVGVPVILGSNRTMTKAVIQYPGDALKLAASQLQQEMQVRQAVARIIRQYAYALLRQIIQSAGCNALHSVEQRLARFLLTMQDRSAGADLPLSQRFIADVLGVRRETVALVASTFQRSGYITYIRGTMTIGDRDGLSEIACECYDKIRKELRLAME